VKSGDIPSWALAAAQAIMQTVLIKDVETFQHCVRVGHNSRLLAQAAGLNEYEQRLAEFAGLFHDIGKIGVPESILNKPSKLNDQEYEIMKSHPEMSVQILEPLKSLPFFAELIPGILHHHERIDGRGYPFKKNGDDIPLEARIILIADTFDAMTADRVYRKGLPIERAQKELIDFSGTQFDAQLVSVFNQALPFWKKLSERRSEAPNGLALQTSAVPAAQTLEWMLRRAA
jgi:putative nucleotidyltransferase with HDIG domain